MKKKYLTQKQCNYCYSKPKSWEKLFSLNETQNLMQCRTCQLIFNDRSRIDFENIYGVEYFEPSCRTEKQDVGGYYDYKNMKTKINKEYKFAIDFITRFIKKHQARKNKVQVLDVGCGYGFFLANFKTTGASLYALEISDVCVAHMKKKFPYLNVIKGDFIKYDFKKKFDIICMFEFIEHMTNPAVTLAKAYRLLCKDGYLIITTPNIGNPSFKILKRNWPAIHPQHHNYYFTKDTLTSFLRKTKFHIQLISEEKILYFSYFHIRNRLTSVFPFLSPILKLFASSDETLMPIFSGGSLNVIAKK